LHPTPPCRDLAAPARKAAIGTDQEKGWAGQRIRHFRAICTARDGYCPCLIEAESQVQVRPPAQAGVAGAPGLTL
jgi:hypothetical protein